MNFWDSAKDTGATGGRLTEEDLRATFEAIKNAPPHPCSLGNHVVSPRARYRPGWYVCGNCMMPVEIKIPLSEL
jgi:hypothetical protein